MKKPKFFKTGKREHFHPLVDKCRELCREAKDTKSLEFLNNIRGKQNISPAEMQHFSRILANYIKLESQEPL